MTSVKPLTERLAGVLPTISTIFGSEQAHLESALARHFPDLWPRPSDAARFNPLSLILDLDSEGEHHRLLHWLLSHPSLRPAAAAFLQGILTELKVTETVAADFLRRFREGKDLSVWRSPWYGRDYTGSREGAMPDIVIMAKPYLMIIEIKALSPEGESGAKENDLGDMLSQLLRYEKVADKLATEGYVTKWLAFFALDAVRQMRAKPKQFVGFCWHQLVPMLARSADAIEDAYFKRLLKDYIAELQNWIARRSGLLTAVPREAGAARMPREARVFVKAHFGGGHMSGKLFQDLVKAVGPSYADLVDAHSVWVEGVAGLLEPLTKRTVHGLTFEFGGPAPQNAWRTRVKSRQFVALARKKKGMIKMRIRVVVTNLRGDTAAVVASMVDIETGLDEKRRQLVRDLVQRSKRKLRDEKPDAPLDFFSEWISMEKVAMPAECEKWADQAVRTALDDAERVCSLLRIEPKWVVKE